MISDPCSWQTIITYAKKQVMWLMHEHHQPSRIVAIWDPTDPYVHLVEHVCNLLSNVDHLCSSLDVSTLDRICGIAQWYLK
jgi:hypothetical protein